VIAFIGDARARPKRVIVQVKSGAVHSSHIRDLRGTLNREKAAIGVLITLKEPISAMETEAGSATIPRSKS
jgi:site-specific DNA-methyltransferase (adenine-specific)